MARHDAVLFTIHISWRCFPMSLSKLFATIPAVVGTLTACLTALTLSTQAYAASAYTLVPEQYGIKLKAPNGSLVFEYVTKKPENIGLTSPSAAYFDPVNTPSASPATTVAPTPHPT